MGEHKKIFELPPPSYLPRLINIYPQVIVIRLSGFGQIFEQRWQLFVAGHQREDDQGQKHFETSGGESWQEPMVDPPKKIEEFPCSIKLQHNQPKHVGLMELIDFFFSEQKTNRFFFVDY